MNPILLAALLLGAPAAGGKIHCKDGTWQEPGKGACKRHGAKPEGKSPDSPFGGKRPTSEGKPTAICNDHTFWRGELDEHACEGRGGVKEPL